MRNLSERVKTLIGVAVFPTVYILSGIATYQLTKSIYTAIAVASVVITISVCIYRYQIYGFVQTKQKPRWKNTSKGIMLTVLAIPVTFIAGQYFGIWAYVLSDGSTSFNQVIEAQKQAPVVLMVITTMIIGPIAEEALMRGFLYDRLRHRVSVIPAIIITTLVFSALHMNVVQIAVTVPLSIVTCLLYEVTQKISVVAIVHIVFNAFSLVIPIKLMNIIAGTTITLPIILLMFTVITMEIWKNGKVDKKHIEKIETM